MIATEEPATPECLPVHEDFNRDCSGSAFGLEVM